MARPLNISLTTWHYRLGIIVVRFAPGPNSTLHIVPDWYQPGMSPNPVVSGQEDALSSLGSSSGSFFTIILDLIRKIFNTVAALFTGAGSSK